MTLMAQFRSGKPIMIDNTPTVAYNAGDVVLVNNLACIAHIANPYDGSTTNLVKDALAVGGGVYDVTTDNVYEIGTYVYWNPSNDEITTTSSGNYPFGLIVGGTSAQLSDDNTGAAGTLCTIYHCPLGVSGGFTFNVGATANDNISNTNTATAFATTATIPAGIVQVGDVLKIHAVPVVLAQNSTNTNTFKVNIQTSSGPTYTLVVSTGALNIAANTAVVIEADIIFTAVGNSGLANFAGYYVTGTTATPFYVNQQSINTNEAMIVQVTDTQSAASTGNNAQLDNFQVSLARK